MAKFHHIFNITVLDIEPSQKSIRIKIVRNSLKGEHDKNDILIKIDNLMKEFLHNLSEILESIKAAEYNILFGEKTRNKATNIEIANRKQEIDKTYEDMGYGSMGIGDILIDINIAQNDIREKIITNTLEGKHNDNNILIDVDNLMQQFTQDLSRLLQLLESIKDKNQNFIEIKDEKIRKKSPKSQLKVIIDGKVFYERKAKDTFVKTIEYMSIEQAQNIITVQANGNPFISKNKPKVSGSGNPNYEKVGNYYIVTHFSNDKKRTILEKIAKNIGVEIQVEIIEND